MLALGDLMDQVVALEIELAEHVLLMGRTQAIGNLEAKFNPGRTIYDWEKTVMSHPTATAEPEAQAELVEQYTKTVHPKPIVKIDWRGIADHMDWDGVIKKDAVPSVSFKLVG